MSFSQAVCQALNLGCTYTTTAANFFEFTWTDVASAIALLIAFTAIVSATVHFFGPNRASRTAILWALAGLSVGMSCFCVVLVTMIYGIVHKDPNIINFVVIPTPPLVILLSVSICILIRSTIQMPTTSFCFPFFICNILCFVIFHFFPLFPVSTLETILLTVLHMIVVSSCLTSVIGCFHHFVKTLIAEKLYIEKDDRVVGYLAKKGEEWIEVYYQKKQEAKDSDEKKLILNV